MNHRTRSSNVLGSLISSAGRFALSIAEATGIIEDMSDDDDSDEEEGLLDVRPITRQEMLRTGNQRYRAARYPRSRHERLGIISSARDSGSDSSDIETYKQTLKHKMPDVSIEPVLIRTASNVSLCVGYEITYEFIDNFLLRRYLFPANGVVMDCLEDSCAHNKEILHAVSHFGRPVQILLPCELLIRVAANMYKSDEATPTRKSQPVTPQLTRSGPRVHIESPFPTKNTPELPVTRRNFRPVVSDSESTYGELVDDSTSNGKNKKPKTMHQKLAHLRDKVSTNIKQIDEIGIDIGNCTDFTSLEGELSSQSDETKLEPWTTDLSVSESSELEPYMRYCDADSEDSEDESPTSSIESPEKVLTFSNPRLSRDYQRESIDELSRTQRKQLARHRLFERRKTARYLRSIEKLEVPVSSRRERRLLRRAARENNITESEMTEHFKHAFLQERWVAVVWSVWSFGISPRLQEFYQLNHHLY